MNAIKQIKLKKPNQLSAFFICVIIAIVLWLLHSLNTVYTKQFTMPVEFVNLPQNKFPAGELPKEVKVQVKASGLKLLLIGMNEPFKATPIDFNELKSDLGKNRFFISSNLSELQATLKFKSDIKGVYPDTIAFVNRKGTQKQVVVSVPLNLNYAPGFTSSKIKIDPERVLISGAENELKAIDTIYTLPVYLSDIKTNVSKLVNLNLKDKDLVCNTSQVKLEIEIDELIEKEFVLQVLPSTRSEVQYNFYPSKVKVKVSMALSEYATIDTTGFRAYANVEQKMGDKLPVNLVNLPKNMHLLNYSPKEVEYLIIKK